MNTAHKYKTSGLGVFLAAMTLMLVGALVANEARAQTASSTATSSSEITGTVTSGTGESGISDVIVIGAGNGTAIFKWTTENPSTSWVSYGPLGQAYTSVTPVDETLTTDHAVTVTGLTTDTAYHYAVSSRSSSGTTISSLDRAFVIVTVTNSGSAGNSQTSTSTATTTGSTGTTDNGNASATTTATTTTEDVAALHARIADLESQLANLWAQFQAYIASMNSGSSGSSGSNGGSTGTTTSSSSSTAYVSNNSQSARLGTNVDFTGHGFWANEPVEVSTNGSMTTTARADSMGNFSTGSMPVQSTTGNQTFTFRGSWSGMTATGMVNVTQ